MNRGRKGYPEDAPEGGPEGLRSGWVGGSGAGVGEGRTFPILYITTPDQPPHGGVTGNIKGGREGKEKWGTKGEK